MKQFGLNFFSIEFAIEILNFRRIQSSYLINKTCSVDCFVKESHIGLTMSDEFDDLDDYLDEFDEEILAQEPGATIPQDEQNITPEDTLHVNSNIDSSIAKNIEEFMNELDPNGDGNKLNELLNNSSDNGAGSSGDVDFTSTINETINRIKVSSKNVDNESTKSINNEEELLTTLLNSLDIGDLDGGMEGMDELKDLLDSFGGDRDDNDDNNDDDGIDKVSNVLMKMLNKLTSKEMMYDTIKSAVSNYEGYFKENKDGPDHGRYLQQFNHLKSVKEIFDDEKYNENDSKSRDLIDIEMEKFNSLLPPPPGVIQDDLANMGLDGVKWNDKEVPEDLEGCVQQ